VLTSAIESMHDRDGHCSKKATATTMKDGETLRTVGAS
jgi:hypothetical protein